MIVFQVFIKFWPSERNTEDTVSNFYLNEDGDHSEENTCKNEVFRFAICARENNCEFCEIFKNTFFTEQLQATASEMQTLQKRYERNRLSLM